MRVFDLETMAHTERIGCNQYILCFLPDSLAHRKVGQLSNSNERELISLVLSVLTQLHLLDLFRPRAALQITQLYTQDINVYSVASFY